MARRAYSTDLTDAQWALIEPFLRVWKARRVSPSGYESGYDLREIVNALFYQNRTGCQWALLPHDLPLWSAVYYYFGLWRDDGTDQAVHDLLRCQARGESRPGRGPERGRAGHPVDPGREPRAGRHDGQGRRQEGARPQAGLAVDALGLIIAVVVTAASATDNAIGIDLIDKVVEHTPTVTRAYVDAGFKDDVMIHGAVHGITVEQVKRSDTRRGFVPIANRWVVERTNGTLMLHRRLTRGYESLPASSVSHTLWSSTAHLTRRLNGTTTPTWRTPTRT